MIRSIGLKNWISCNENRYFLILLLFLVGLLFSKFILSVSQFLLLFNWLTEEKLKLKWEKIKQNKSLHIFLLLYFIHIVGLLYTTDFNYAFKDLRVKLPLLVLPLIFSTATLTQKSKSRLIDSFLMFVFISTVVSLYYYLFHKVVDTRQLSIFMSHIRFSLLVALAMYYSLFNFYEEYIKKNKYRAIYYLLLGVYFLIFNVYVLASINGIIVLLVSAIILLFYALLRKLNLYFKIVIVLLFAIFIATFIQQINEFWSSLFPPKKIVQNYPEYTLNGNKYVHYPSVQQYENGNHVYSFICEEELDREWSKKSKIRLYDKLKNGSELKYVLLRYLSSMGLPKDSSGVAKLSPNDVSNIEQGITNYKLEGKSPLYFRLYELLWGYYNHIDLSNPADNSLLLRIELWKTSLHIIKKSPILGVGTGDLNIAFAHAYKELNSKLEKKWQLRSHNQYLSITIAFGIIGLIVFLVSMFYPVIRRKAYKNIYFLTFFIIILLSMFSEDTIETQVGVSIFAFWYSFFVFLNSEKKT